ncbi:radical SAM protein [Candidatus Poriferisodalis sp.]|uniref:radical SAM protein n=1 Tax=Candidatus Poriferisodalis sp. TaxID=3101277 RepID=UPI003B0174C8
MTAQLTEKPSGNVAAGSRLIANAAVANACFFRSGPEPGRRKALLKVTDRCDLRCSHCFVSATQDGEDMPASVLRRVIERLCAAGVANVTITGGEPLLHPELPEMLGDLVAAGLDVTVCTNGVSLDDTLIHRAIELGHIKFSVSLDGVRASSHGKFRGNPHTFAHTVANARRLAGAQLLNGVLCTPHDLMEPDEHRELLALATELGARYLLLNPLSSFGRGMFNQRLAVDEQGMHAIQSELERAANGDSPQRVFVRFPNSSKPLTPCIAGDILYVFVNGNVTVCPYLVFATENPGAQHHADEFIVGNLFDDADIVDRIEAYDFHSRFRVGSNDTCSTCAHNAGCGKGCPAAVIANGGRIGDLDADVCPVSPSARPVSVDIRSH